MRTGHVRIEGPMDDREKASFDQRLKRRAEAQEEVNWYADRHRRCRTPGPRARYLEDWHFEQRIFDIINDSLPPRYRAKLENRSWAKGASREGKALEEIRKSRAMQREYFEG